MITNSPLTFNPHLNIFRFFNETSTQEFIENNLSRAFALSLSNDNLFFNEYIKAITLPEDYDYLFSTLGQDATSNICLQIDIASIANESFRRVYAVAMTTENLDMIDFLNSEKAEKTRHVTDIVITIKDITYIIEVKRTGENCKAQLYNQALPFIKSKELVPVIPVSFSWPNIIKLMERTYNVQMLNGRKSVFLRDFIDLAEGKYHDWFESKPFNLLEFSTVWNSTASNHLYKRLKQVLQKSNYEISGYSDRLGVLVPFGWATEVIPGFEKDEQDTNCIAFYIWPGNTKTQGYGIYSKDLSWTKKKTLTIGDKNYPLDISLNVKLSHFNKFISQLNFYESDLIDPNNSIHSKENFDSYSGKWPINSWPEFETYLDGYLKPEYNWRKECNWKGNFLDTDRSYFTVSFGFEVAVYVPFKEFQEMDKKKEDLENVAIKVNEIVKAFESMIK